MRVNEPRTKLLAIASGGGHWVQLLRLRPAFEGCTVSFATVQAGSASDVPGADFHVFHDASRKDWWRILSGGLDIARIVWRVKPNVIVSTGAMPPLAAIVLGRMIGARTLWIDSVANSEQLSTSGKIAARLAHRTVTQWPSLRRPSIPFWGTVL